MDEYFIFPDRLQNPAEGGVDKPVQEEIDRCSNYRNEAKKDAVGRQLIAEDAGLRNAGDAHGATGEGDPVVQDAEDDDLEGEGGDNEIVVTGAKRRPGDEKGYDSGQYDPCREAEPEGEPGLEGKERGRVCADAVEGGMCHGDEAGEARRKVQGHGNDGVDPDHDKDVQQVLH